MDGYFIVLDEAPIQWSQTPKFDLLYGDFKKATGFLEGSSDNIKDLLKKVPLEEPVYRTFLQRTDGKEGHKLIRLGQNLEVS